MCVCAYVQVLRWLSNDLQIFSMNVRLRMYLRTGDAVAITQSVKRSVWTHVCIVYIIYICAGAAVALKRLADIQHENMNACACVYTHLCRC